jgi:hypothetical protein
MKNLPNVYAGVCPHELQGRAAGRRQIQLWKNGSVAATGAAGESRHHGGRPSAAAWAAAVALIGLVAAYLAGVRLSRFVVCGPSMEPTLRDGDRLLVLRGPARLLRLRRGALVVARPRALGGREVVKRIAGAVETSAGRRLALLGDNAPWSADSRSFGPVSVGEMSGRVLLRYWPDERRGPVR